MKQYLDVPHYIDYVLLHFYIGHEDWGVQENKNWYTIRKRAPGEGFKYLAWDGELTMNSPTHQISSIRFTPSGLHTELVANAQYRLDFADSVRKHLFNNGALTPANAAARFARRAKEVEVAMVAESARWGDYRRDVHQYSSPPYELYTRNGHFNTERNRLLTQYFPVRTANVLSQLRSLGLYPMTDAPGFSQHGGLVPNGFKLGISGPGTIYYTLDGTDPRVIYTGAVAPGAAVYSGQITLSDSVVVKARSRNGPEWSALTEAVFQVDTLAVPLVITEIMYNPIGGSPYEFIELQNAGPIPLDVSGYSFEGINFIFPPNSVLSPGQIVVIASGQSPSSFATRYPGVPVYGYFEDALSNGGERIGIRDFSLRTIASVTYHDDSGWPTTPDGGGYSLELLNTFSDPNAASSWLASNATGGTPGFREVVTSLPTVRLNEIMAANVSAVSNGEGFPDWVELFNESAAEMDISGWVISDVTSTRQYTIPEGTIMTPNSYLVIWCDSDFTSPGLHTGFALDKLGETLFLFNLQGTRLDAISFGPQVNDLTLGRMNDGPAWNLCSPTPGSANIPVTLAAPGDLIINEWLADALPGESDWLEIHNTDKTKPAALSGLYLSTSNAIFQIRSSTFIPAGGFVALYADEGGGADHVDFKLSAAGGYITLHDVTGVELSRVTYNLQAQGTSEGRLPDGSTQIVRFPATPTPAHSNYLPLGGVVINEVLPLSLAPLEDAIEFHNPSETPVDIGGFFISDDELDLKKFQLPAQIILPPGGYEVVYEADFGDFILPEEGGEIWLSEADSTGNLTGKRTRAVYGPAEVNVPFGKFVTSVETVFAALTAPTFGIEQPVSVAEFRTGLGAPNSGAKVGPLAITEIMYHPVSGVAPNLVEIATEEFIELRNLTASPLALYTSGKVQAWEISSGINFTFPAAEESVIPPNGFVLLVNFDPATNTAALADFREKYNPPASAKIFGPFSGRLSNSGEEIRLLKPAELRRTLIEVEEVDYLSLAPWPAANGTGNSLHRVKPVQFANDPVSWVAGPPTAGWIEGETQTQIELSAPSMTGSDLSFIISADQGTALVLESSSDLDQWQTVSSTNSPAPPFTWTIQRGSEANQFYRLRVGP